MADHLQLLSRFVLDDPGDHGGRLKHLLQLDRPPLARPDLSMELRPRKVVLGRIKDASNLRVIRAEFSSGPDDLLERAATSVANGGELAVAALRNSEVAAALIQQAAGDLQLACLVGYGTTSVHVSVDSAMEVVGPTKSLVGYLFDRMSDVRYEEPPADRRCTYRVSVEFGDLADLTDGEICDAASEILGSRSLAGVSIERLPDAEG